MFSSSSIYQRNELAIKKFSRIAIFGDFPQICLHKGPKNAFYWTFYSKYILCTMINLFSVKDLLILVNTITVF